MTYLPYLICFDMYVREHIKRSLPVLEEKVEVSEMEKFVVEFMQKRAKQNKTFSGKRMTTLYIQTNRFNRLAEYVSNKFTGAHMMNNSEMFDFAVFLLEGFLKGSYQDYKTFDECYVELEKTGGIEKLEKIEAKEKQVKREKRVKSNRKRGKGKKTMEREQVERAFAEYRKTKRNDFEEFRRECKREAV